MTCFHLYALLLRLAELPAYPFVKSALLGVWPGCG